MDDQPELQALVRRFGDALADDDVLDPIPDRWLHLTVHGVGHVEEIEAPELTETVRAVSERLAVLDRPVQPFQRATLFPEGAAVVPTDVGPLGLVHEAIRAGVADALGSSRVPEQAYDFVPHVTIAYANGVAETKAARRVLDEVTPEDPVRASFARASLIKMHRDRRQYEWEVVESVQIGQ